MTIAAILNGKSGDLLSAECGTPVKAAVAMLAQNRIGSLPVTKEGRVVGIISERDILYCLASEGGAVLDRAVEEVMTSPAITVTKEVSVLAALSQMSKRRIRHLPVVEGERLIGIVSIGDLVAHRISRIEQEAEEMRNYIRSA
jgi:CBS domain-containing protein